jgi:hypothetical protein
MADAKQVTYEQLWELSPLTSVVELENKIAKIGKQKALDETLEKLSDAEVRHDNHRRECFVATVMSSTEKVNDHDLFSVEALGSLRKIVAECTYTPLTKKEWGEIARRLYPRLYFEAEYYVLRCDKGRLFITHDGGFGKALYSSKDSWPRYFDTPTAAAVVVPLARTVSRSPVT